MLNELKDDDYRTKWILHLKLALCACITLVLLGQSAPAACHGAAHVIAAGGEDDFRGLSKPTTPSLRLLASYYTKSYPPGRFRGFDQDGEDLLFVTSLPLPARKICSAQFEVRVRRKVKDGLSYDFNDFLLIGFAPFAVSGERRVLFRAPIWVGDPPSLAVKTARIRLPAAELNRFVLLTGGPHYLDIVLHDDTAVDYVKLSLRFE